MNVHTKLMEHLEIFHMLAYNINFLFLEFQIR